MRPGRPIALGQLEGAVFLGLPGNPVSANVTFILFGAPGILAMQGATHPGPVSTPAQLLERVDKPEGLETFHRGIRNAAQARCRVCGLPATRAVVPLSPWLAPTSSWFCLARGTASPRAAWSRSSGSEAGCGTGRARGCGGYRSDAIGSEPRPGAGDLVDARGQQGNPERQCHGGEAVARSGRRGSVLRRTRSRLGLSESGPEALPRDVRAAPLDQGRRSSPSAPPAGPAVVATLTVTSSSRIGPSRD